MQFKSAEELKTEKLQSIVKSVETEIEAKLGNAKPSVVLNCVGTWCNLGETEQAGESPFAVDFLASQDDRILQELKDKGTNVVKDRFSFQLNTEGT